ncbi:S16 family serine protease [Actinotignum urinale]|uniref:S16 family serine protease n=1 Tax=Actinotignum urinale TaxID=190146 RepID=A0AAW9HWL5_9ACTO|nr:S16 family serine protease [Actinotignum urinale]MDY5129464.1 S16 family serine protease [Actinotignum urinale]MDY5151631.1 S16 family serine protease [Actinotignum urinale]MDY5155279.1 S16 family serine protease [Actinotignum urinale]
MSEKSFQSEGNSSVADADSDGAFARKMEVKSPRKTKKGAKNGSLFYFLVATCLALIMPGAYLIQEPGPMLNLSGEINGKNIVTIDGARDHMSSAKFYMTTVSTMGDPDFGATGGAALLALFSPNNQLVPVRAMYPKEVSTKQIDEENRQMMQSSQDSAADYAIYKAGYRIEGDVVVYAIDKNGPGYNRLMPEDIVRTITFNGETHKIPNFGEMTSLLDKIPPKSTIVLGVDRGKNRENVDVTTQAWATDPTGYVRKGSRIGVSVGVKNLKSYVKVKYAVEGIGGPSAGLMFTLAIYDRLTEGNLGKAEAFAGTGTINGSGEVGPIGGIRYKMVSAHKKGIKNFLAPVLNCDEVNAYPQPGMNVWAVRTFDEARQVVDAIGKGETPKVPQCSEIEISPQRG